MASRDALMPCIDAHYERIVIVENSPTDDGEAEQPERVGCQVELGELKAASYDDVRWNALNGH